jgi:2-polyprenyl-3-methyl-5-hydroxy-6-metoxy-1,4-benzoquinol methylase
MSNIKDKDGYNQVWKDSASNQIRSTRRSEMFIQKMGTSAVQKVLEIGCGLGTNAYYIAQKTGMQVTGIDICEPFIQQATITYPLPNLKYEILDFNNPDKIAGRKFDYIIGNGILHHLYDHLDAALLQFKNLLNPNGKIIFMEPNIYNPYCALIFKIPYLRKKANLEPDEMAFSKPFIQAKLSNLGFKNITVRYKDFLLPGLPLVLVKPVIAIGNIVEKIPVLNMVTQSIFIEAQN